MVRIIISFCIALIIAMPSALAETASDCFQKEDLDREIKGCTLLIEDNPNEAVGYYNRGVAYRAKADYDRAIAD
jgi:hypothetical protein